MQGLEDNRWIVDEPFGGFTGRKTNPFAIRCGAGGRAASGVAWAGALSSSLAAAVVPSEESGRGSA